jgi:hypothetical protein
MVEFTGFANDESDIPVIKIGSNGYDENTDTLSDGRKLDAFDYGFLDYVGTTAGNILPSAGRFAGSMWDMISQPVTTAKNIGALGSSIISLVRDGEQGNEQLIKDVGQFFADRYGGAENLAQTLRDDPIGFLADASMILTGGASLSARLPTVMAGAVAKNLNKVAKAVDPINVAIKVTGDSLKKAGQLGGEILGTTTGIGSKALTTAYMTGYTGENALAFTSHMRGGANKLDETLNTAQKLIGDLKTNTKEVYIAGKNGLNLADTPIDPNIINKVLLDFKNSKSFNGALELSKEARAKLVIVEKLIADFNANKGLHNARGLDFLKRQIDNEYPTGFNQGDATVVISSIRDGIKKAVVTAVPEYVDVMKSYEDAITLSKDLEKGLGLQANASAQLTLNKLNQSIKNNSASQFGNKGNQLSILDDSGKLESMLSGDALNSAMPRSLQSLIPSGLGMMAGYGANPLAMAGLLATSSPRLMGEASHLAGKVAGTVSPFVNPAIKTGVGMTLANDYSKPYDNMGTMFTGTKGLLD